MERVLTAAEAVRLVEESSAAVYRRRGVVSAYRTSERHVWTSHSGSRLAADPGDWMLSDGERTWSARAEVFEATYQQVGPGLWRKTALVRLLALEQEVTVETLEGRSRGRAGDYLAVNPGGDVWPIPAGMVPEQYVPVEED